MGDGDDDFPVGTVVWANLDGFPWWPGRVTQKSDVDFDKARDIAKPGQIIVQFFNDNDRFTTMDRDKLQLFLKDDFYEQRTRAKGKSQRDILGAVREAWGYIETEDPVANRTASLKISSPTKYEEDITSGKTLTVSQLYRRNSMNSDGGRLSGNPPTKKRRKPVMSNDGGSDVDDANGISVKLKKIQKKRKKMSDVLHIPNATPTPGSSSRWQRASTSDLHIPAPKEHSGRESSPPPKREDDHDEPRSISDKKKRPKGQKLKRRRPVDMDTEPSDSRGPRRKDSSPSGRKKGKHKTTPGSSLRKRARHSEGGSDSDQNLDKSPVTQNKDTKNDSGSSDRHIIAEGSERTKAANLHSKPKPVHGKVSLDSRIRSVPDSRKEELIKREALPIDDTKQSNAASGTNGLQSDRIDDDQKKRSSGQSSDESANASPDVSKKKDASLSGEGKIAKNEILEEADKPPVPRKKNKFRDSILVPDEDVENKETAKKRSPDGDDRRSVDLPRRKERSDSDISPEMSKSERKGARVTRKYNSDDSRSDSRDSHRPSHQDDRRSDDSGHRKDNYDDGSGFRGRRGENDSDNDMSDVSPRKTGGSASRESSDSESNRSPVSKRRARPRRSVSDDKRSRDLSSGSKEESGRGEDSAAFDDDRSKIDDKNMGRRGTKLYPDRSNDVADRERSDRSDSNNCSERSALSDKESPKYMSRDRPWANGTDEVLYSGRDCVPEKNFLKPYTELSKDQLISLISRREVELRWCNLKLWRQGAMLREERICRRLPDLREQCNCAFKTIDRLVSFASAHFISDGISPEDSSVQKPDPSEADLAKFRKLEDEACVAVRNLSNIYFDEKIINLGDILQYMLGIVNEVKGISRRATAALRDMTLLWADVYAIANNIESGDKAEDLAAFTSAKRDDSEEDTYPHQKRKPLKRDGDRSRLSGSPRSASPQGKGEDGDDEPHRRNPPEAEVDDKTVKKLEIKKEKKIMNESNLANATRREGEKEHQKVDKMNVDSDRGDERKRPSAETKKMRTDVENSREEPHGSIDNIGARKVKPDNAYGKSSVEEAKKIGGPHLEITDESCAINDGSDKPERGERYRGYNSDKGSPDRRTKAESGNKDRDHRNREDKTGVQSSKNIREQDSRDRGSSSEFAPPSSNDARSQRANETNDRSKASKFDWTLDAKKSTVVVGSDSNDEREGDRGNVHTTKETGEADKKWTGPNREDNKLKRWTNTANGKTNGSKKEEKDPGVILIKLPKERRDRVNLLKTSLEVWRDCNGDRIRSGNRKDMAFALENAVWTRYKDDDYRKGITALQRGLQSYAIKNEKKEDGESEVDNEFSRTVKSMVDDVEQRVSNAKRLVDLSMELLEKGRR